MSAKSDMHKLSELSVKLTNFFDLKLASYLLHTGEASYALPDSCDEWFHLKEIFVSDLQKAQLENLYYNLELPLAEVLFGMERDGFKIDEAGLTCLTKSFLKSWLFLHRRFLQKRARSSTSTRPKQVAGILFDKLGLVAYANKKRSTGIDVLEELKYSHPIVEKIIQYRKYQKLKSTYIDVYKRICAEKGSIIHTSFHQALTNTGRISSSDPNLQNIPTNDDEGKVLRQIFHFQI